MNSIKKVLHIQLLPLLSGVQRVSLNEINEVTQERKNQFNYSMVCSYEGPLTEELNKSKIKFYTIPELKREISPFNDLKALYKLYKLIKSNNFDVVHTHSSKTGLLGRIAAKTARITKVVHTVHGFSFPAAKGLVTKSIFYTMEWMAKFFTDELIVLNMSDYNIAVKKLGYDKKIVSIVPNGVNVDKFSPSNIVNKSFRVVMVGRLWEQKNPMCLIEAAKLLLDKYDDVDIHFIGDGELRVKMEQFITDHDLSNNVKILGWLDNVNELLPNYDVFVLPSLWEGMPLAILEAQACGLPTIVSDIPGNSDLVLHESNGLLFEKHNYIELSKAIEKLYLDTHLRLQLSKQARRIVCDQYSSEIRNEKILNLYVS